jgi:hypothetical protein
MNQVANDQGGLKKDKHYSYNESVDETAKQIQNRWRSRRRFWLRRTNRSRAFKRKINPLLRSSRNEGPGTRGFIERKLLICEHLIARDARPCLVLAS